jgi:predicted ATPase/DNA-binding winged helix-turn-helix (wHTH) protein
MPDHRDHESAISFGPYRLLPQARLLERDGAPVRVKGRALDVLIVLAERPGEVVNKRELVKRVWGDVNVDEGTLRFHMTALRKALGDGVANARYVVTVAGRGYCFVARPAAAVAAHSATGNDASQTNSLPAPLARMIGRSQAIEQILTELSLHRFVTIVGPGGIGKTSVAVAVAHRELEAFEEQVFFVDLGALSDASLVPSAIASALRLGISSEDPMPSLLAFLRGRRTLLIFDSCEHVLDTLAPLAERLAREVPELHILATSRESFRIEDEQVFRLFPLNCPPERAGLGVAELLSYPAVELFIKRATASHGEIRLDENEASLVGEICRRLDGIALAIELAAGRVDAYGIAGTASMLNSRFSLQWRGRRTAVPRHQTLSAALGWSYDLLPAVESATLRRLSVFVGQFSLEAAVAVASYEGMSEPEAVEAIANLLAKSLIATPSADRPLRYRLLDTTRAFVREKLVESGEANRVARAHAEYFRDFLKDVTDGSAGPRLDSGLLPYGDHLPNVRAALDWCFSDRGDHAIGVELAAVAAQFFLELSLLTECYRWTQQAIASLDAASIGSRQEMELQAALGVSVMFTQANTDEVRSAFIRSLYLAEKLGDLHWQLWLLRGLHIYLTRIGDFHGALGTGEQGNSVARMLNDPVSTLNVEWMRGVAHHLIGNQDEAVELCESAMTQNPSSQRQNILHLGYDDRIVALVALARGLWLTGRPDRAIDVAKFTISEAEQLQQPLTLGIALIWTIYVFLWVGDWSNAEGMIERLIAHAQRHFLGPYHAVGIGLKGELLLRRGDVAGGLELLCCSQATLYRTRHRIMTTAFATAIAEALTRLDQLDEAERVIDGAIAQIGERAQSFDMAEMLRVKGCILDRFGRRADTECFLRQSLDIARKQRALGWELRGAVTLGRILRETGRASEARALIAPLYARYEEGFDSIDLLDARNFLNALN